jgi:hypothetical protein
VLTKTVEDQETVDCRTLLIGNSTAFLRDAAMALLLTP